MIQGRGLVGERMDPMVKVKCGKHIRQTLRTKGTYNPFFDEVNVSWEIFHGVLSLFVFLPQLRYFSSVFTQPLMNFLTLSLFL